MPDRVWEQGAGVFRRHREVRAGEFADEVYVANTVAVTAPVPLAADVVGGTGAVGATILTVPAGRVWRGSVSLVAASAAAVGAAASAPAARVDVVGAGATPPAGALVQVPLALPASTATATAGTSDSNAVVQNDVVIVAPAGNAVTLAVAADAGVTSARGTARGVLL